MPKTAGTPTDWLRSLDAAVVEVLRDCLPILAAERYASRRRHPGHFDDLKTAAELVGQFERLALLGPLELGALVRVDTATRVDVDRVA